MQSENGGVIGMLEVIQSDFARLEAETTAAEETAQKEYDEFMTDAEVDKAQKTKDIEHKTAKKTRPGAGADRKERRLGGHSEGARRGARVFRQAETFLRGCWCELRGPCGPPKGGDRIVAGGAAHPQRGRYRVNPPSDNAVSELCMSCVRPLAGVCMARWRDERNA